MTSESRVGNDLSANPSPLLYAEDLAVGDWIDLGPYAVTAADIVEFATRWDPLPMHVDPVAAAASSFGELIASGIHTLSIFASMASPAYFARVAVVAGRGFNHMWLPNPVRVGSVLRAHHEVAEVNMREYRADVTTHSVMRNENGDVVLDLSGVAVIQRRPTD